MVMSLLPKVHWYAFELVASRYAWVPVGLAVLIAASCKGATRHAAVRHPYALLTSLLHNAASAPYVRLHDPATINRVVRKH